MSTGMPRPLSRTSTDPSAISDTSMWSHTPARASSTELSMISHIQCMRPRASVDPIYIAGRLRTASRPSRTCSCLLYTSPSPRDGHLSIRRQRQMCIKRQVDDLPHTVHEATSVGRPDIHRRTLADRLEAFQDLQLSLIHISEPTRRTPLYSSAASDVYKETGR